jgi:hypothetical protein
MGDKTQKDDGLASMPYARELDQFELDELRISAELKKSSQNVWELLKRYSNQDIINTNLVEKMSEPIEWLTKLHDLPFESENPELRDSYLKSAIPRREYASEIIKHINTVNDRFTRYKISGIPLPQFDYLSEIFGLFVGIRDRSEIMDIYQKGDIGSQVYQQNSLALNVIMDEALQTGDFERSSNPKTITPDITTYELNRIEPLTPETVIYGHQNAWKTLRDRSDLAKQSIYKIMILMKSEDPRYVSYPYILHEEINLIRDEKEKFSVYEISEKSRVR